jgi:Raf kinase inhibitor-like YbhB/YbcL family protein
VSPPLEWSGAPAETQCFALLCEDPDAPAGTWHHWALFDLAPTIHMLDAAYPTDARVDATRQAVNDFKRPGYGGPCPPPGHGVHHYHFRLLSLSVATLEVGASPTCVEVQAAARDHVLAEAVLTGTYSR